MTMNEFIPVNEPLLDGNEKKYLLECIDSGWVSSEGRFVEEFEKGLAAKVERGYGVAVCNGSAALDVAVAALEIGPGDEIILPTFTIISCAAAVIRSGAKPILVDADPETWCIDANQIEKRITRRTKAIMAVHTYGLPADMDPIIGLANKYGLMIIEDAAEAHGLQYKGHQCGSFGDISVFSFYANKHITSGEGGMVLTNDEKLADRCRSLRNLCFQSQKRFVHEELGWNYRMSNLQAAVGLAQLESLDASVVRKRWMGHRYSELLRDVEELRLPLPKTEYAENIYWVYGILIGDDVAMDASSVMQSLSREGIGTRPFFWPMHQQPVFGNMGLFVGETYPTAETIARRGFYLPSGLALTEATLEKVSEKVKITMRATQRK